MVRQIALAFFGIVVHLEEGGGMITSELHEEPTDEFDTEYVIYNGMMDAIESTILAHASAGVDITQPAYQAGIVTAVQACANNC